MKNHKIAKILFEIGDFLQIEGSVFKPFAYQNAAISLDNLEEDVEDVYLKKGLKGLKGIPGVGESIAKKIEEYIKTGQIKYYKKLKKSKPFNLKELSRIEGLGPKKIKVLYEKLEIRNVKDLEKAIKKHKISKLFGFGEKTEKNLSEAIDFFKKSKGRFLISEILPIALDIKEKLEEVKEIKDISLAGSLRRRKETIGDADILVASDSPQKVMNFFINIGGVEKVWVKGPTKSSIRTDRGFNVDLRVVSPEFFGSALQYFTGSKEHNIKLRKIAIKKNFKLSEYGLFKKNKNIASLKEEDVYAKLGINWIPPELREDQGEIEAGLENMIPNLVKLKDIKGDLHIHTNWNGGANTIKEMVLEAKKRGYRYIGISDHAKFLKIENGLDEKKLLRQGKEIDKLNKEISNFTILKGVEANILKDGSLDIKDEVLKTLDFVNAGVHSNLKMDRKDMTERIIKAIKNPYVKILAHPTGRVLNQREEYQADFERIFRAAKQFKTVLEINSSPKRLDLNDKNAKMAKDMGIVMAINSDSHQKKQLSFMEFGVYQARRAWLEKKDVVNTMSINQLKKKL